ncbi:hypothetical protein CPB83DRAFT_841087 [Crepidotus variabilis]|uniref:Uncharacterized protein n=1 Tax=Crepidotus variabilis TaxID=179855 RepID=A0A9P6E362_9AGAR|nr:hypothetical protein CPB83DRAFT_841087 [Crepidotus variabilis]
MTDVNLEELFCEKSMQPSNPEIWTALHVSSKARHGELLWSSYDYDSVSVALSALNDTTGETILAQLYEGLTLPTIIIGYDKDEMLKTHTIPKVIRGNKIVHALVEFELKHAKTVSEAQKKRMRSVRLAVIKYDHPLTREQQAKVARVFDQYSMYLSYDDLD